MLRLINSLSRRHFLAAALALAAIAVIGTSRPAAAQSDPTAFIETLGEKALSSLTAQNLDKAEREKRVRSLLRTYFDVDTIGRFVLGPNWRSASDAQRGEYIKLFERMIVSTYAQRFSEYSGQSIKVGKAVKASERDTVVSSQILQQGGPPISVDWRVRNSNGQLRIIDVLVEGISMSVTQRSDFAAVIQRGGIDGLIDMLRERTGK